MPHRHTIRAYAAGYHYHIYNRGVEKRSVFKHESDYHFFLSLLDSYLTPKLPFNPKTIVRHTPYWRSKLQENEVELLCYCLMPNHFHLLLKQNSSSGITKFMRRIANAYVKYFNKKYDRVGSLFQGKFKAVLIETEPYLLHLSRYIHLNPSELEVGPLDTYPYSSYPEYLGSRVTPWVKSQLILDYFSTKTPNLSYHSFIKDYTQPPNHSIEDLTLE